MAYEPNWVALRLERELQEEVGQHQEKAVGHDDKATSELIRQVCKT